MWLQYRRGGRNNTYETHASESSLGNYLRLAWLPKITNGFFMRSESFYQFASHVDEMPASLQYYGGRSLHEQSHGSLFSVCSSIASVPKASICSTSPKPHCPQQGSCPYCGFFMICQALHNSLLRRTHPFCWGIRGQRF